MHRQTYNAGSISLETCAASSRPCRKSGTCRKVEARIDSGAVMPFSVDAFLDVFAAYNTALWPFALLLWVATTAALVAVVERRDAGAWTFGLLAVHWAWSAIAYHIAFFTRINPAAWLFAAFFLAEAVLLLWFGVVQGRLQFASDSGSTRSRIAYAFIGYGLLYPLVVMLTGHSYPRMPAFGVPCPTTIVTIGFLMLVAQPPIAVVAVPLLWTAIAGTAAWLLRMPADLALLAAGFALLGHLSSRRLIATR
jgi:uncharacterized protein DUF6064